MNWYLTVLKKYAVFSGRARRKEYWFFVLFNIIVSIILSLIDLFVISVDGGMGGGGIGGLSIIYALAVLIPSIAVSVRRLHDTDRTGWWCLIALLPVLGAIVLLIFMCLEGTQGDNGYGANPVTD